MPDTVVTAASTYGLTLANAKLHLNVSSTADDALITTYIQAGVAMLEQKTQRCFVYQTRQLTMDSFADPSYVHNRRVYLPRTPLTTASSTQAVQYYDQDGTLTTMPSTDYVWSTAGGYISEAYNATWPAVYPQPGSVVITYRAGHGASSTSVPLNIQHALKMLVGHWYRNREAVVTGAISKEIEMGVDALLESEMREVYA